jgi:hypothetical protein
MNAFEPLLWIGAAYLFVKADETNARTCGRRSGLVAGSVSSTSTRCSSFSGLASLAIALTPSRRSLVRPGFALAVGIALAIVAPTLVWQWRQRLASARSAARGGRQERRRRSVRRFYVQQILMMNPLAAPIWIAGLARSCSGARRCAGTGSPTSMLSIVYLVLGAKVYYLAPIYPVLFAAGASVIEQRLHSVRWAGDRYPVLLC